MKLHELIENISTLFHNQTLFKLSRIIIEEKTLLKILNKCNWIFRIQIQDD